MTHKPFQPDDELLSAYIDGELTADELRAVEEWIATDPAAQALVEDLRNVSSTVQSLPRTAVPAEWTAKLAQRLDDASAAKASSSSKHKDNGQAGGLSSLPIGRSKRGWWFSAAAIAAAVAIMLFLPQDANNEVAKNTPLEKAPATGAEVASSPVPDMEEMSAPAETEGVAADRSLDTLATAEDMPTTVPEAEAIAPEATHERSDFARVAAAPDSAPDAAPMPPGSIPTSNLNNAYLIVWCDVPPETLRQREINNVLGDNGIVVEERTESWLAAAEPVRQQIELRNSNNDAARGGFGGRGITTNGAAGREAGAVPASRFSVPDTRNRRAELSIEGRNQPTPTGPVASEEDSDELTSEAAENAEDKETKDVEIEGETILVDARADQIASCLAAMQSDPGNYASITVEPVSEAAIAEQLAQRQLAVANEPKPEGFSYRAMVPEDEMNGDEQERAANIDLFEPADDGLPTQQSAAESMQLEQNLAQQAQRPQARRLERPEAWYYYNTAPQNEQEGIRLPVFHSRDSKVRAKGNFEAGDKKAELAELNRLVEQQQQVLAKKTLPVPLQEQQPVQVLFVLRNSFLPAATESPATTSGEIAPAEAAGAVPER